MICRSTRNGVGCSHPVDEHDGNPDRDCCCCNWLHNDPGHWQNCFRCQVRYAKGRLGMKIDDEISCGELEPHLPENVRAAFWDDAIGRHFARAEHDTQQRREAGT